MSETRLVSGDETARLLRAALAVRFPGCWMSVRPRPVLGTPGLVVRWADGPTVADVEAEARVYGAATFDPVGGRLERHESLMCRPDGQLPELVLFGADLVLCARRLSRHARMAVTAQCERWLGGPFDARRSEHRRLEHLARTRIAFDPAGWPLPVPAPPQATTQPSTPAPVSSIVPSYLLGGSRGRAPSGRTTA